MYVHKCKCGNDTFRIFTTREYIYTECTKCGTCTEFAKRAKSRITIESIN